MSENPITATKLFESALVPWALVVMSVVCGVGGAFWLTR